MLDTLPDNVVYTLQGGSIEDPNPKWSGPTPVPKVGDLIEPKAVYRGVGGWGQMEVIGYEIEHGWVYVLATPHKWPDKAAIIPERTYIYVAGIDLIGRKPRIKG